MTIAELKEDIKGLKINNPTDRGDEMFNMAIEFCLQMIDIYDKYKEDEYPLGRNDYQE